MTVEQVASGVRGLGRLHGMYWGKRLSDDANLDWVEPFAPWDGMQYAPLPAAQERLSDDTPTEVMELTIDQLVDGIWKPYIRSLTRSPQTLLHGDPHIGNTYVLPDGEVGFLDWQVLRRGNWSLDLGYFVQGALTTEDRRRHERALLEQYRDALGLPADELPDNGRDLAALSGLRRTRPVHLAVHGQRGRVVAASGYRCGSGATVFDGVRGSADRPGARRHRLRLSRQAGVPARAHAICTLRASLLRSVAVEFSESPPPRRPMSKTSFVARIDQDCIGDAMSGWSPGVIDTLIAVPAASRSAVLPTTLEFATLGSA